MDDSLTGQIILIIALIFCSAYFSSTETAFTSVNRIRMKNLASDGNRKAEKVLTLSDRYDKLLTTILVGNNIVNIWMTAIATALFIRLYGNHGATIATIVITIVVLIFGAITPKNIAKEKSEEMAMMSAPIIGGLMTILTPVNFVFTKWKQLTGDTPKSFILNMRLRKSAEMLREHPEMSIAAISERNGFTSAKYFCKCFKDCYKIQPSAYRKGNTGPQNDKDNDNEQ